MPLEDIIKKIDDDARAEADSLLSLAKAEADAIRDKARKQAEDLRQRLMQQAKERALERASRIRTLAGLDQRKELLAEKKRIIDEAFARAEEKIVNLPKEQYLEFVTRLMLGAVESGREEIIPSARHKDFFSQEFLENLNKQLGPKGHLRLSGEAGNFSAGVILREGNKETNLTLKSLIAWRRDHLEPEIARMLFGQKTHE
jgi:V/A-type H+-transporting ATPase subunit E